MQVIQHSGYISNVPLQERLIFLERFHQEHGEYSIHELCEAIGVARGTFYNHILRRADRSKYEDEQAQLAFRVQQIFDDYGQHFGAEKIRVILAESGIRVGTKRIAAIMRELGLHSIRTDAKKQYKRRQRLIKQNLLSGILQLNGPIKFGLVTLPALRSVRFGYIFVSSWICMPERLLVIGFPKMPAQTW